MASESFKIYTKTGDKGTSALYTGDRLEKNNSIFECLGAIDEINANLGLAREHCLLIKDIDVKVHQQLDFHIDVLDQQTMLSCKAIDVKVHQQLEEIQARLIDLGSHVATPRTSEKIGSEKK